MKLPVFAQNESQEISAELSPEKTDIRQLIQRQSVFNKKAVTIEGQVQSVVNIDETDEATVASWFIEIIPTTVKTTASATYFYVQDGFQGSILVKYPAGLDVSAGDALSIMGVFSAHDITIEKKAFLHTKREQVMNALGEPFITALLVENKTKQRLEYIRKTV